MKAYVQVYTGEGKGKTTAAIGLAIRAIGAGKKVLFLQFMKSKVYSEHTILPTLTNLTLETVGKPFFIIKEGMKSKDELAKWGDEVVVFESGNPPKDYVALIEKGYERALAAISSGEYDLVVLDEYNMALFFELITWDKTKSRNGQWDMGHIPGEKYSEMHQLYMDDVISKDEFLEWYRNPKNYRPELPGTNRSHKYE